MRDDLYLLLDCFEFCTNRMRKQMRANLSPCIYIYICHQYSVGSLVFVDNDVDVVVDAGGVDFV